MHSHTLELPSTSCWLLSAQLREATGLSSLLKALIALKELKTDISSFSLNILERAEV